MVRLALACAVALALTACGKQESTPAPETSTPATTDAGMPSRPAPVTPTAEGKFDAAIKAEDFAARLERLASDQFEGRKPGTIGERATTAYIKDQFERIGLKPGNKGSWFQTVPMIQTTLVDAAATTLEVSGAKGKETFAFATDMWSARSTRVPRSTSSIRRSSSSATASTRRTGTTTPMST